MAVAQGSLQWRVAVAVVGWCFKEEWGALVGSMVALSAMPPRQQQHEAPFGGATAARCFKKGWGVAAAAWLT